MQFARLLGAVSVLLMHIALSARTADSEEARNLLSAREESEEENPVVDILRAPGKIQMEHQKRQMKMAQMRHKMEYGHHGHGYHHPHHGHYPYGYKHGHKHHHKDPYKHHHKHHHKHHKHYGHYGAYPGHPNMYAQPQPQPGYYQAPQPGDPPV
eukprot:TRINITY_DN241_c0_g3_i3.p2 TRINITY_DN241_c0_g3~~TRINITY_DN241_c0_g3_i3.p2  ORF type:complete len:154 (+),score=21.82 TRINITY_DN241_c0_g3_i3:73-534(+)